MRVPSTPPIVDLPADAPAWARNLLQTLQEYQIQIAAAVNGNLGFGDGVDAENIRGQWITYVSNGVADTEDTVAHTLGAVPKGYLVFSSDKAGVIYKGTTAWTSSNIYLRNNVASVTALIFVYASL